MGKERNSERENDRRIPWRGGCFTGVIRNLLILAVIIIAISIIWRQFFGKSGTADEKTTIITSSNLEKVLRISELSTYKVTFNGVAAVKEEEDLLYNVSYEAKVSVGLDMEKIKVEVEDTGEESKKIVVTLPEIQITVVDVDPGSLDYIFEKDSANTDNVSMTALPACRVDAEEECKSNDTLLELARENAVNTVKALIKPLLEQYDEYTLEIVGEGGYRYE